MGLWPMAAHHPNHWLMLNIKKINSSGNVFVGNKMYYIEVQQTYDIHNSIIGSTDLGYMYIALYHWINKLMIYDCIIAVQQSCDIYITTIAVQQSYDIYITTIAVQQSCDIYMTLISVQ